MIPHFVVIVTEPRLIEKEALLRYVNDADNQVGITTLFAYGDIAKLPKSCKTIIQSDVFIAKLSALREEMSRTKSQMSQLASTIKYCADRIQREDQRVAELAAALKAGH